MLLTSLPDGKPLEIYGFKIHVHKKTQSHTTFGIDIPHGVNVRLDTSNPEVVAIRNLDKSAD